MDREFILRNQIAERYGHAVIRPGRSRRALAAAVLFGASTPIAKRLGLSVSPLLLAGLLYLGSGVGLATLLALHVRADGRGVHDDLTRAERRQRVRASRTAS